MTKRAAGADTLGQCPGSHLPSLKRGRFSPQQPPRIGAASIARPIQNPTEARIAAQANNALGSPLEIPSRGAGLAADLKWRARASSGTGSGPAAEL